MSVPPTVSEGWTPEPELRDTPPRRIAPSDTPDMNKPPVTLFIAVGGGLIALGVVLLLIGLVQTKVVFILLGIVLALGGAALMAILPQKAKMHLSRAENLVTNGVPVIAQILTSDNMTGDSVYGRSIKYQVTLPGGEMVHRSVNAYDPALPKRIPGPATALVDMSSGDAELYCVLPFRAISKTAPIVGSQSVMGTKGVTADTPPAPMPDGSDNPFADVPKTVPGTMGTIGPVRTPIRPAAAQSQSQTQSAPATEPPTAPKPPTEKKPGTSGLPWE